MAAAPERSSWRKRHPVLSRLVLYALGAALVGLAVVLLRQRSAVDAGDRLAYLSSRLEALDVVMVTADGPREVLKVLDDEFADAALPPHIQRRALRIRAQAQVRRGAFEPALDALDRADAIAADESAAAATDIERAEILGLAERFPEGLELLRGDERFPNWSLELRRRQVEAWLLRQTGEEAEALRVLEAVLAELPQPLPEQEPVVLGMGPQHLAVVARLATEQRCALEPCGAEIWRRLVRQLPGDPQALTVAADRLEALGRPDEAEKLRARAASVR